MADEKEKVVYEFQGDSSSLKAATKDALSMLGQYENTIRNLAKSGNFEVGKTAFNGFQRTVNGIIKQVNTLSNFMGKASQENKDALTPNTPAVTSAYKNIADALNYLQQSTKVTTDDIKLVNMVLQESKAALDPVAAKAQALGTSFASVAQVSEQSMTKVNSSVQGAEQKTSSSVTSIGQQWDNYINRMSKSAEMSAQVFAQAGKFDGFVSGIEGAGAQMILLRSLLLCPSRAKDVYNRLKRQKLKKYFAIHKSHFAKQCDTTPGAGNLSFKIYSLQLMYKALVNQKKFGIYVKITFSSLCSMVKAT